MIAGMPRSGISGYSLAIASGSGVVSAGTAHEAQELVGWVDALCGKGGALIGVDPK